MNEELAQTALRCAVCHDQCISACPVFESTRQLAAYPSRKAMISREVDRQLLPPGEDAAKIMRYCIGCKACLETCLHKSNPVDITPVVRHTRRELYISGEISAEFKQLLERIEKWGNPYGDLTAACQLLSEVITGKGNAQEKILLIADASEIGRAHV